MLLLLILEETTHFVEGAAGRYLNAHNNEREPWGTTWEVERKSRIAARRLAEEVAAGSKLKEVVERVESFAELVDILPNSGSVHVSPTKFVSLYMTLPQDSRNSLAPSEELLDLYYNSNWVRTSVKLDGDIAVARLIDSENQVVLSVTLSNDLIRVSGESNQKRVTGGLADNPAFTGHVYPAERFFAVLFQLSEQERGEIFPDAGLLLGIPKPVAQVGLAPTEGDGFALAGFESSTADGPVVTLLPLTQTAFDRLTFLLAWAGSDTLFREQPVPEQPRRDPLKRWRPR